MKTLLRLAALGGLAAFAVQLYRRNQRWDRELPGDRAARRGMGSDDIGAASSRGIDSDQIADTNTISSGNAEQEQRGPQPQDWRGAQNVLE
jgi:hypothetical protein